MITLTKRQKDAYDFIKSYASTNGYGPSYEEISTGIGFASKSSPHRLVYGLVDRGLLIKHLALPEVIHSHSRKGGPRDGRYKVYARTLDRGSKAFF